MDDAFHINCESLKRLGIDPRDGVTYLENKEVMTLNPVHVIALQVLRGKPAVQTS